MAVLYILLDLEKEQRSLAFKSLAARKWPSLKPILGALNIVGREDLLSGPTEEQCRTISSYLEYTEQLVRLKDVRSLSPEVSIRRNWIMDLLHRYWKAGVFPDQYDYMGNRKLACQDRDGRLSALAWIVRQSAGPEAQAIIDKLCRSTDIRQVDFPAWRVWMENSGLTQAELTML